MAIPDLEIFEKLYFIIFLCLILCIIIVSYRVTHPENRNLSMSLIFAFIVMIAAFFIPESFLWLLFLVFALIMFNIVFGTFLGKFVGLEEDKLLIDKVPQIWETFSSPPELKEEKI